MSWLRRRIRDYLGIGRLPRIQRELDELKILTGRLLLRQIEAADECSDLADVEFRVYSQFGDDGIIQYLLRTLDIEPKTFIEFGVEDYREANTRFLLALCNWKGLVIDGDRGLTDRIRKDDICWQHDLSVDCSFVDCDNINDIFTRNGFSGDLGLLSIDVDGNDYWIWEAITCVNPALVVVEYNSVLGPDHAITIPYNPAFSRTAAHHSNLYWGASLGAFCRLAGKRGYSFVGSNSAGNNAYFVRNDKLGTRTAMSAKQGYVQSKYRESRDSTGQLTFLSGDDRIKAIKDMPVVDLERDETVRIRELFDLA